MHLPVEEGPRGRSPRLLAGPHGPSPVCLLSNVTFSGTSLSLPHSSPHKSNLLPRQGPGPRPSPQAQPSGDAHPHDAAGFALQTRSSACASVTTRAPGPITPGALPAQTQSRSSSTRAPRSQSPNLGDREHGAARPGHAVDAPEGAHVPPACFSARPLPGPGSSPTQAGTLPPDLLGTPWWGMRGKCPLKRGKVSFSWCRQGTGLPPPFPSSIYYRKLVNSSSASFEVCANLFNKLCKPLASFTTQGRLPQGPGRSLFEESSILSVPTFCGGQEPNLAGAWLQAANSAPVRDKRSVVIPVDKGHSLPQMAPQCPGGFGMSYT